MCSNTVIMSVLIGITVSSALSLTIFSSFSFHRFFSEKYYLTYLLFHNDYLGKKYKGRLFIICQALVILLSKFKEEIQFIQYSQGSKRSRVLVTEKYFCFGQCYPTLFCLDLYSILFIYLSFLFAGRRVPDNCISITGFAI